MLLKGLLEDYNTSKLGGQYYVRHFKFWGRPIKPFIWACIHKDPSMTVPGIPPYKLSPQLLVLLGDKGISAGLANGVEVQDTMPCMARVRSSHAIQTDIFSSMQKASNWVLQPGFTDPAATRPPGPNVSVVSINDVGANWFDRPRVIRFSPRSGISRNIEFEVVDALDEMAPIFKQL